MSPGKKDYAETYRSLSDEELSALCGEIGWLTEETRAALWAEVERRRLSRVELLKQQTELFLRKRKLFRVDSTLGRWSELFGVFWMSESFRRGFRRTIIVILLTIAVVLVASHPHFQK